MGEQNEESLKKTDTAVSIHNGHRDRMKNKFLTEGLDHFEPHAVLELLLYYAIPLKDTNPIGHALLNKFGSLSGVFDAPYEELLKVDGIGKSAATLIKLIPQVCRRYQENIDCEKHRIFSYDELGKYMVNQFIGRSDEVIMLMLLDGRNRILHCGIVSEGSATAANIYIKKIVRLAVQYNAVYAVLSHNHPSGNCMPSKQDLNSTQWIYEALETVEVKLLDHIIVGGNDFISLAKSGIMQELFKDRTDLE
jgi:DNA repair protein RadC